jgi:hypothetical protein
LWSGSTVHEAPCEVIDCILLGFFYPGSASNIAKPTPLSRLYELISTSEFASSNSKVKLLHLVSLRKMADIDLLPN